MRLPAVIESRRSTILRIALFAATGLVLVAAIFLRVGDLDHRPMHGDEAVNTVKAAQLAGLPPHDDTPYRYDPHEYHGPTLPYLTLPSIWVSGADTFADTDEATYRAVPLVLGVLVVGVTLLLGRFIGWPAALIAGVLCAVSPAMIFFSRYYIHEMPLVLFTGCAIYAGFELNHERRPWPWAVALGVALGLMHATKETFVISVAIMTLAFIAAEIVTELTQRDESPMAIHRRLMGHVKGVHTLIVLAAGGVTATLLFTQFGANPRGIVDAVLTYKSWLRIGAEGGHGAHLHPFPFYLARLFWHPFRSSIHVTELLVGALALVGIIASLTGWGVAKSDKHPARCLAFYAPGLLLIYSLIPYKTPWSILSAYHGLILLAGIGAAALIRLVRFWPLQLVVVALLAWGVWHLHGQNRLVNGAYDTDPGNPWVYAHPVRDLRGLIDRAAQIEAVHADMKREEGGAVEPMPIVVAAEYVWPLPFELRAHERVGYYPAPPERLNGFPFIVTSMANAEAVASKVDPNIYLVEHFGHRPGVVLRVYIRRDLWDRFMADQRAE